MKLAHDSVFWRKLAHLGASRGPEWWLRYSPPFFGWAAALLVPKARRAVLANLRAIHGERAPLRETIDVARTFGGYAGCLAEVLSNGSKNERLPEAVVYGDRYVTDAVARGKGVLFVTAHTAGWELVGPLIGRDHGLELMLVMEAERDAEARALQDEARSTHGLRIAHVGNGPLDALPLLAHLRRKGAVAIQIDRVPQGMRSRDVSLFGRPGQIPEGPLKLAELSGAPIVPVFTARIDYRRYRIEVAPPIDVPKRASDADLDAAAQRLATAMSSFLRSYPTGWFHFGAR